MPVCLCVQYGIKKKVPIEPSQDPALEGRLGRKKKTPEEMAAEAELAEQQALRSSTYNATLIWHKLVSSENFGNFRRKFSGKFRNIYK